MSYKEIIVEKKYHNCRLDKLLVDLKLVENKSRALSNIMMGHIFVNQKLPQNGKTTIDQSES